MVDISISAANKALIASSSVKASRFPKAHLVTIPSTTKAKAKANFFDIPNPGEKGYYPELVLLMQRINETLAVEGSFYLALARMRAQNPALRLVVQSGRKGTDPNDKLFLRLTYSKT